MSTPIYHPTDYRKNITLFWRQYFPSWEIPKGYHVHHIKPQCTFKDKNDPNINHYRNLIALHPDDHRSIHKCRGDIWIAKLLMTSVLGRKHTPESIALMKKVHKGKKFTKEHKLKLSAWQKGKKKNPCKEETKRKISETNTGKPCPEERKKKISNTLKGRKIDEDVRLCRIGKTQSYETKLKRSLKMKGRRYYNNGLVNRSFFPGDEPSNFSLGFLKSPINTV